VASSKRQAFLLRVSPEVREPLRRWADDELRSVNGQVEFLLRKALVEAGRLPRSGSEGGRARWGGGTTPSEPVNGDEAALS